MQDLSRSTDGSPLAFTAPAVDDLLEACWLRWALLGRYSAGMCWWEEELVMCDGCG